MRSKKTLSEEVYRMRVLMETRLINEQWKAIADVLISLGDELGDLVGRFSDDFQKLRTAVTDEDAIKILADLAKKDERFANEIIPRVYDAMPSGALDEINKVKDKFIKMKQEFPKTVIDDDVIEDSIRAIDTGNFPGLRKLIINDIKDAINGVVRGTPTPKPDPSPVVDSKKIIDQMESVFKRWDSISPGTLSIKDKALLVNETVFRGLRAKLNWLINNLMNSRQNQLLKSEEKIVGLLKQVADSYLRDAKPSPELFKVIDAEIDALRGQKELDKTVVYDLIRKEIDKVVPGFKGSTIVGKLKEHDALGENAKSYFQELIDEKLLKDIVGEENLIKGKNKINTYINWTQRILIYLSTGYITELPKLFNTYIRKHGAIKGIGWMYFYFWTLSKFFYPAVFALWDWMKNGITGDENFEDTESALWEFYKRELNDAFGVFRDDFMEVFGYQIPAPVATAITTLNPFTWMWDDVKEGLDWFTKGGLRTLLQKLWNGTREFFGGEIPTEIPQIPNVPRPNPEIVVEPQLPNITPSPAPSPGGGGRRRRPGTES
jgi:hypothetical protein